MSSESSIPPPTSPALFYKIETSDKEVFEISEDVMKQSELLSGFITTTATEDPIPLGKVTGPIMKLVIEWCEHHKGDVPDQQSDDISQWDKNFLGAVDRDTLFELIVASNYLDIKGLLDVTCKMVCIMQKGKSPEELRRFFNTINDAGPEEEE